MNLSAELREFISNSQLDVVKGSFFYCLAHCIPLEGSHFAIAQDLNEVTVITDEHNSTHVQCLSREGPFALLAVSPCKPFAGVGFLAAISTALAAAGLNVLVLSTFSKDYFLVHESELGQAVGALNELGLQEK